MSCARPLRALFLGFGNVGRAVAEVLEGRAAYPGLSGFEAEVVGIVTANHGAVANAAGLDLREVLAEWAGHGSLARHPDGTVLTALEAVRVLDYDVMVEMTPLGRHARGEPAVGHVREALARGRHVVSANKGPLAWAWSELSALAARQGTTFLHEATVMDGAPVFSLARHGLRGATVSRVEGILNSTTNVVLGTLEDGGTIEEGVARAQRQGLAEADPRDDLEGWDGAVKLAALANVLMGAALAPEDVEREGVASLEAARPRAARARGARLKLVCEAWRHDGGVRGQVSLRELPREDPFALVEGASSILRIVSDLGGTLVITEEHPDLRVTAYGVVSDLLTVAAGPRPSRPRP